MIKSFIKTKSKQLLKAENGLRNFRGLMYFKVNSSLSSNSRRMYSFPMAYYKDKLKDDYVISNILEEIKEEKKQEQLKKGPDPTGGPKNSGDNIINRGNPEEKDSNLGRRMTDVIGNKIENAVENKGKNK